MQTNDRTKFLGGSDAAAVLGLSPWKTPLQLWQDKVMPAMPENADPDRMRVLNRGKRMEPYVCDLLAEEKRLRIVGRNNRYVDREYPFLACEIDAEAFEDDGPVNIEIKTVSPFKAAEWGEIGTDAIPVHYTAQAMHGLMITGRASCVFGVLIGGDDFRVYRVERDDETIAALRAREVAFWREHVEAMVPPPATDASDIERLFPRDAGSAIEADTAALVALNELRALEAEAGQLKARIDGCKEALQRAMGGAARLTVNGRDVITWKTQTARRFDQRAFQAAHPDLFEQFIKTTESRVFRLR
ncbi:YqaJ viral recombinase family protein [Eleftheria terrae]|uniref:YqaJ viral recombinase family nuclease n=1 Tax=Eleftheria terrae TaxID=1597781 RepID=UPI00263AE839|nr:YqaJ viral recombinase family protein [Eleftheria terrae]WKB52986.1 YqaJ viral recombinase family protein [Eleftheria terrae]